MKRGWKSAAQIPFSLLSRLVWLSLNHRKSGNSSKSVSFYSSELLIFYGGCVAHIGKQIKMILISLTTRSCFQVRMQFFNFSWDVYLNCPQAETWNWSNFCDHWWGKVKEFALFGWTQRAVQYFSKRAQTHSFQVFLFQIRNVLKLVILTQSQAHHHAKEGFVAIKFYQIDFLFNCNK